MAPRKSRIQTAKIKVEQERKAHQKQKSTKSKKDKPKEEHPEAETGANKFLNAFLDNSEHLDKMLTNL